MDIDKFLLKKGMKPNQTIEVRLNDDKNRILLIPIKDLLKDYEKALNMHVVSRPFNSEGELLSFIYRNIPIAIKPKSKLAKSYLVNPFTSNNAFEQVCKELAKKLYSKLLNAY